MSAEVKVLDHPLIQHKLTLMRRKKRARPILWLLRSAC
jgi:uracil phosphoribosyltransferase